MQVQPLAFVRLFFYFVLFVRSADICELTGS